MWTAVLIGMNILTLCCVGILVRIAREADEESSRWQNKAKAWEKRWHESACLCDDSNALNGELIQQIADLRAKLAAPDETWASVGERVGQL